MEELFNLLEEYGQVFVLYDRNVEGYALQIAQGRPAYATDASEAAKNMDSVTGICRWLLSEGADRSALLLNVGGGVTTDMGGFAASIYKRGIRYANIPTTLLSQVDAAIGGKTGVNLDGYKNMLGVIVQPEFTYILPETLETLPEREFRSGAAEMLKTFIIKDDGNYEKAVKALSSPSPDLASLAPLIRAAAAVKEEIVEQDPYESGLRRVLNLGHTIGHAIEWRFPGRFTHGEAVAMGIIYAARKSETLGYAGKGLAGKISEDFRACSLPVDLPCGEEELLPAVLKDKKAEAGAVNWVLIRGIGRVETVLL